MTKEQKRLVTEWLGECFHDIDPGTSICPYCNQKVIDCCRTFTTWDDFGACYYRLRPHEDHFFEEWSAYYWYEKTDRKQYYDAWFHSRTETGEFVLCELIAEAIKEGIL